MKTLMQILRPAIRYLPVASCLLGMAAPIRGQAPVRRIVIPDEVSCSRCRIVKSTLALTGSDSVPLPEWPINVRVDGHGRVWVFSQDLPPRIHDANGRFLRLLGARGAGPGEYNPGGDLFSIDRDTVAVYDIFNRRLSIVSPEFRTVRMVPAGFLLGSVLVIDPKRFLTAGFIRTPDNIGYALHVVKIDPNDGLHIERSFGGRGVAPSPATGAWEFNWDIKPSMNGRFWTAERLAYRIQLWDQNGVPQLMLERQPKWFRPQTRVWLGNANTPPNPVGAGVSEEGGVLWTFTHVPDSNWRRAWPEIPTAEIESKGPDVAEVVDTMVEAIDIASWRVIARARMPERVVNVLPGGRVVTFQHDANGETQLKIHTLRIER